MTQTRHSWLAFGALAALLLAAMQATSLPRCRADHWRFGATHGCCPLEEELCGIFDLDRPFPCEEVDGAAWHERHQGFRQAASPARPALASRTPLCLRQPVDRVCPYLNRLYGHAPCEPAPCDDLAHHPHDLPQEHPLDLPRHASLGPSADLFAGAPADLPQPSHPQDLPASRAAPGASVTQGARLERGCWNLYDLCDWESLVVEALQLAEERAAIAMTEVRLDEVLAAVESLEDADPAPAAEAPVLSDDYFLAGYDPVYDAAMQPQLASEADAYAFAYDYDLCAWEDEYRRYAHEYDCFADYAFDCGHMGCFWTGDRMIRRPCDLPEAPLGEIDASPAPAASDVAAGGYGYGYDESDYDYYYDNVHLGGHDAALGYADAFGDAEANAALSGDQGAGDEAVIADESLDNGIALVPALQFAPLLSLGLEESIDAFCHGVSQAEEALVCFVAEEVCGRWTRTLHRSHEMFSRAADAVAPAITGRAAERELR